MKTIRQQLRSARRELRMRRVVYRRHVAEGKMTQEDADYEIDCMVCIVATLDKVREEVEATPLLPGIV